MTNNNAKGQQIETTLKLGLQSTEAFSAETVLFVNFLVIDKYVYNSGKMFLKFAEFTLIWGHLFKFLDIDMMK